MMLHVLKATQLGSGTPIWIWVAHIRVMVCNDEGNAIIYFDGDDKVTVRETPYEIVTSLVKSGQDDWVKVQRGGTPYVRSGYEVRSRKKHADPKRRRSPRRAKSPRGRRHRGR